MGVDMIRHGQSFALPRKRRGKGWELLIAFGPYLLMIVVTALAIFLSVWIRISVVTINYDIRSLSDHRKGLVQENRELRLEYNTLTTPSLLERIGEEELGLTYPDDTQLLPIR
jgi:cell division protein FtsL